jgi:hypothetical protein
MPELQVQLVVASTLRAEHFDLPDWVRVVRGRSHDAMAVSTCLISAAGTATVEAAILGVPLVVAHVTSPLTFELARRIARVPSSCMVNLIAGAGVVPERISSRATGRACVALVAAAPDRGAREMRAGCRCGRALGAPGAAAWRTCARGEAVICHECLLLLWCASVLLSPGLSVRSAEAQRAGAIAYAARMPEGGLVRRRVGEVEAACSRGRAGRVRRAGGRNRPPLTAAVACAPGCAWHASRRWTCPACRARSRAGSRWWFSGGALADLIRRRRGARA